MEYIIEAIMFVISFLMKAKNFYILLTVIFVISMIVVLGIYIFTGKVV